MDARAAVASRPKTRRSRPRSSTAEGRARCWWRSRPPASGQAQTNSRSAANTRRPIPGHPGPPEGAGVVVDVDRACAGKKGDHADSALQPECRECEYCLSRKTNLCRENPAPPKARDRCRTGPAGFRSRASRSGLHGLLNLRRYTVLPEIALAKVREERCPSIRSATSAAGVTDRGGRRHLHRQGSAERDVVWRSAGGIGRTWFKVRASPVPI